MERIISNKLHKNTSNEVTPLESTSNEAPMEDVSGAITKSVLKIQMAKFESELMKAVRKEVQSEMLRLKKPH